MLGGIMRSGALCVGEYVVGSGNTVSVTPLRPTGQAALKPSGVPGVFSLPHCCRRNDRRLPPITSIATPITAPPVPRVTAQPLVQKKANFPYEPSGQEASDSFSSPLRGRSSPLGATVDPSTGAINFAVFSANATGVSLCLFREADMNRGKVTYEIELDPLLNKTGDIWHILLPACNETLLYGYRVSGPNQTLDPAAAGNRFDPTTVVLDPYAKAVIGRRHFGVLGPDLDYESPEVLGVAPTWPQCAAALPSPVGDSFDWEGDRPLNLPMEELVIYEMHVRGFTRHSSSGVAAPGTYLGMIERLDYLQHLGVNAVELLPIYEFNELEYYQVIPGSDSYRFNFWGYSTVNFFSPMSRFSAAAAQGQGGEAIKNEFRTLVKECHRRGIEVILDVVFNHTAEGNEQGLTLAFRGLDNRVYYMLAPKGEYYNYSGCGNTFNCNHPLVRTFILECLQYWVTEMHVDGFRFDLASILTRAHSQWHQAEAGLEGQPPTALHSNGAIVNMQGIMTDGAGVPTGTPLSDPPLIQMISQDPILKNTKLIAEAWDCDLLNQVGAFPHYDGRWSEWNGHFRDAVRMFIKGTDGNWTSLFASALSGSADLYAKYEAVETDWWGLNGGKKWKGGRGPSHSVNFITAHDGFTLADLVAYNEKKNDANGEDNRDGESHNNSWNCGEEGPSSDPLVNTLRQRQMRNFAAALLLSQGVPMVLMGDEYGASKGGNNNTYCHDSALNWLDWDEMRGRSGGYGRFFRHLVHLRRTRPELRRADYMGADALQWHGYLPHKPDWGPTNRFLGFTLKDEESGGGLYCAFNASHTACVVRMPEWPQRRWEPLVDSSKVAPYDFLVADETLSQHDVDMERGSMGMWTENSSYPMLPWSCIVMESLPYSPPPLQLAAASGAAAAPSIPGARSFTSMPTSPKTPLAAERPGAAAGANGASIGAVAAETSRPLAAATAAPVTPSPPAASTSSFRAPSTDATPALPLSAPGVADSMGGQHAVHALGSAGEGCLHGAPAVAAVARKGTPSGQHPPPPKGQRRIEGVPRRPPPKAVPQRLVRREGEVGAAAAVQAAVAQAPKPAPPKEVPQPYGARVAAPPAPPSATDAAFDEAAQLRAKILASRANTERITRSGMQALTPDTNKQQGPPLSPVGSRVASPVASPRPPTGAASSSSSSSASAPSSGGAHLNDEEQKALADALAENERLRQALQQKLKRQRAAGEL